MRLFDWVKVSSDRCDWVYYCRADLKKYNLNAKGEESTEFTPIPSSGSAKKKHSGSLDNCTLETSVVATRDVQEWNNTVLVDLYGGSRSLFPMPLHKDVYSGLEFYANVPLVLRKKTAKELEKIIQEPLIQPLNSLVSICKEAQVYALSLTKPGKLAIFDDLDWDLVHSLLIDTLIRSECFLTLPQFPGVLIKIEKAIPNDRTKSWDCLIHSKTRFIPSLPSDPKDSLSHALAGPLASLSLEDKEEKNSQESTTELDSYDDEFASNADMASRQLYEMLTYIIDFKQSISTLGIYVPKGILLHGPPGVGKSHLVQAVAKKCRVQLFVINPSSLVGSRASQMRSLRSVFEEARLESLKRAVIVFLDEIDSIAPSRQFEPAAAGMVAQLLTLLDGIQSRGDIVFVGATNRPNYIDAALRRPGRFDREIEMKPPSKEKRFEMLKSLTRQVPLDDHVDLYSLATNTNGFVMADLVSLVREACLFAAQSSLPTINGNSFKEALLKCGSPALLRNAALSSSFEEKMDWSMVGGCSPIKMKLRQAIEWPLNHPQVFSRLGLNPPKGILLYGPPGCSKTTMVKIIAAQSGLSFFSLSGASIYSSFLGESEQSIRTLFQTARSATPSVVFLDELDAIVGKRSLEGGNDSGSDSVQERVLSTLLNEMDGIENAKNVIVIGATNRPDMIDAALLRPGRFDQVIYVAAPTEEGRREILNIYTKNMPLSEQIDLNHWAQKTEGYTGADLKGICREAALVCIREGARADSTSSTQDHSLSNSSFADWQVTNDHFEKALACSMPTISHEMNVQYQKLFAAIK